MRLRRKIIGAIALAALVIAALVLAVFVFKAISRPREPEPTVDPHAGMVQVPNGAGGTMWIPLREGVRLSEFDPVHFSADNGFVAYTGEEYTARLGIDVSYYQENIDWQAVRGAGVEFAILRAGYRGYSQGTLNEDERFREYAEGALAAGVEIGAYFFSQAISVEEARQEARFMLSIIKEYDITMPVAFDWETIGVEEARTDEVDGDTVTDCALAFCSVIRAAGHEPSIYMYRSLGYYSYDLTRLGDITLWLGAAGDYPDFYYAHEIWQYSFTGSVPGIVGDVDLNLELIPK